MGTPHHRWLGPRELGAMCSFLATVLLGAWSLPGAWLSGAVVGLGVGLVIAAAVHLRATRVGPEPLAATEPTGEPSPPRAIPLVGDRASAASTDRHPTHR